MRHKILYSSLLCWFFLATLPTLAEQPIKSLTAKELVSILQRQGWEGCEINDDGGVELANEGRILQVSMRGNSLVAWDAIARGDVSLERIDKWNAEHSILARTYVQEEFLMFRVVLILEPGISTEYLINYLAGAFVEQDDWAARFAR